MSEPIATLHASGARRVFAYGAVFGLGALVLLLAFAQPPSFGWQMFLIVVGIGALVMAERLRRATRTGLILMEDAIYDTAGTLVVRLCDVTSVDRGAFAFKPSNGFVLRLGVSYGRFWAPGLWWRFTTRIGVGGVTPSGPAKFMAEQIAARIAARD